MNRSLAAMSCGAALGLGLAGYGLFTAHGTSTLVLPADAAAMVNDQSIARSDVAQQLQTLYGVDFTHASAAQRRRVLDDLIREELFVQRGLELGVAATDPEVRSALVNAVEMEVAADAITAVPREAALRGYYLAHAARYASEGTLTLRHWVFPVTQRKTLAEILAELRSTVARGEPPTTAMLAQWQPREAAHDAEDEFYFAAKIHLGERLFEMARNLAAGTIAEPAELADGIHVVYVVKNLQPVAMDFAAARDQVLNDFHADAIAALGTRDAEFLRQRARVRIAGDLQ